MEFLQTLPVWAVALVIFLLRLIDVPLGTFRTISVVLGRIKISVVLGFFEVAIWVLAISQVVAEIDHHPFLVLFYAGGFAAGNALGIYLERRFSPGMYTVRIISTQRAQEIMNALRDHCVVLARLSGEGPQGPVNLIYLTTPHRQIAGVLQTARDIDPDLFFLIERVQAWSANLKPITNPTGWRAVIKKK